MKKVYKKDNFSTIKSPTTLQVTSVSLLKENKTFKIGDTVKIVFIADVIEFANVYKTKIGFIHKLDTWSILGGDYKGVKFYLNNNKDIWLSLRRENTKENCKHCKVILIEKI